MVILLVMVWRLIEDGGKVTAMLFGADGRNEMINIQNFEAYYTVWGLILS